MIEPSLQMDFDELRRQVATVEQRCRLQPAQLVDLIPGENADLWQSIEDLQHRAGAPLRETAVSSASDSDTEARRIQRKSAILDASLDPVFATDWEGFVVEFNAAAERTFGYARADAVGRGFAELICPSRLRAHLRAAFLDLRATGASGWIGKRFEVRAMKSDGSEFPAQIAVAPIANEEPPLLAVFVHDLTARQQEDREVARYQERLRSITADLLLAEETERQQLAVDLRDGLSQTIALAKLKLLALPPSSDPTLQCALVEIGNLIDHANQSARSITFELSPPVLHELGLEPAVQWLVESIQARYGLTIALEDDGLPKPVDEKTRVILFRAIRELLINVSKHARAEYVHVSLERVDNTVQVTVDDDGIGMEQESAGVRGSGLFSIRERLNHVAGSFDIDSVPGRGTSVCLRAPLLNRGRATLTLRT